MIKYPPLRFILPLGFFLGISLLLWKGLSLDPKDLASPLIGKPSPSFYLPTVEEPQRLVTEAIFKNKVVLLNVWATWCRSCILEHEFWMKLPLPQSSDLLFVGLNYHDTLEEAQSWLKAAGNPYHLTIFDKAGRLGMDYGVYGTPETFILDKKAVIRYRHAGPITPLLWKKDLLPIIQVLRDE